MNKCCGKMMQIDMLNVQYSVTIKLQFVKKKNRKSQYRHISEIWKVQFRHCNKAKNHYMQICFPGHILILRGKTFFAFHQLAVGLSYISYVVSFFLHLIYCKFFFFYHEWMLNFIKCSNAFSASWEIIQFLSLHFVNWLITLIRGYWAIIASLE